MHLHFSRNRRGITLIELLVVIAIIAILLGLTLPAIQRAREAANNAACCNNLKQLGVAIHHYHDNYQRFPTGGIDWIFGVSYTPAGIPYEPPYQTAGWLYQILPFIEQDVLYRTSDISSDNSQSLDSPPWQKGSYVVSSLPTLAVGPVSKTPLKVYYCPSRRSAQLYDNGMGKQIGLNDYASLQPSPHTPEADENPDTTYKGGQYFGVITRTPIVQMRNGGAVIVDNRVSFTSITDGTSQTLMVAEKFVPVNWYGGGYWGDDDGPFTGWDPDTVRSTVNTASYCSNPLKDIQIERTDPRWKWCGFVLGSAHISGVNALFADGSVQRLRYDIPSMILNALGHRSDGLVLDPDSFD
jgi:prepilin-type N-terminal cleavage/methylation domain-containing protein/prepilin-type processing-associated H-X9-DG protein